MYYALVSVSVYGTLEVVVILLLLLLLFIFKNLPLVVKIPGVKNKDKKILLLLLLKNNLTDIAWEIVSVTYDKRKTANTPLWEDQSTNLPTTKLTMMMMMMMMMIRNRTKLG